MAAPRFEITPKHVVRFFQKEYRLKVSQADARHWLKLWGYTFALELKEIVAPHLSAIFRQATLRDYPSEAFSRFYRKIQDAMSIAEGLYEDKIGMEARGSSMIDADCCQMVRFLMKARGGKREAVFWQDLAFVPVGAPRRYDFDAKHSSYRFHVVAQGKKATARIMDTDENIPRKTKVFGKPGSTCSTAPRTEASPSVSTSVH